MKDHELIEAKSRLEGAAPELVKKQKVNVKNTAPKQQLRAGDEVKVLTFGQKVNYLKSKRYRVERTNRYSEDESERI